MPCFSVCQVFFAFFAADDPCTASKASLLLGQFCWTFGLLKLPVDPLEECCRCLGIRNTVHAGRNCNVLVAFPMFGSADPSHDKFLIRLK
jgi:hypothetical protein